MHISTGDIFRREIKNKTPLGIKVQSVIEKGELVPDELLVDILKSAIKSCKHADGYLFDGFPRTLRQAEDLDGIMKEFGCRISQVLALEVEEEELVGRLLKRARLEGRKDDTEEVIRNRMNVYYSQTQPLMDFYNERGLLIKVNGLGDVDGIFRNICHKIDTVVLA